MKSFHNDDLYYNFRIILEYTWYKEPIVADVGGITLLTKKNNASSGLR